MSTLHVTLRCLKHPATMVAIGLLLVNDHWLKASFASWWTGKLSDFAGLFFFPFLVAVPLGLILDRKNVSPIVVGQLAIGVSGIWFASVKTVPFVNAATCALQEMLVGHPVQVVLDLTDLIALTAMVPAWLLWKQETGAGEDRPGKRAWLTLGLSVLAAVATDPPPPPYVIDSLQAEDGKIYAYGSSDSLNPSGSYTRTSVSEPLAYSADGGRTWDSVPRSTHVPASPRQPSKQDCDPRNSLVCYRILPEQVQASRDGGKTYEAAWGIPWGRRSFMQRESRESGSPYKQLDIGPYDLIFVPPVGANGLSTVVFAMGNEGVLVHKPEGEWERYAVWTASPTPFASRDILEAFRITPWETDVAAFLALATFSLLSFRAASVFKRLGKSTHSVVWAIWPAVAIDFIFLVGWGAWIGLGFHMMSPFILYGPLLLSLLTGPFSQTYLGPILLLVLLGLVLVWVWKRIAQLAPDSDITARAFWRTIVVSLGMLAATWGVLVLWGFGIIPLYELAVGVAVILAVIVIGIGIRSVPGELPRVEGESG